MTDLNPEWSDVVLTFVDSDGRCWLAGGTLSPLVAEYGDDTLRVSDALDKALTLISFKVVRNE